MNKIVLLFIALAMSPLLTEAQTEKAAENGKFLGEWKIDLRPTPSAEGYYQTFAVTGIQGNSFEGTFYGSPIENGLINGNWDRFYFAFSTRDNTHEYYHSGYVLDGKIYGMSYCPGRQFTAPWTGALKK